MTAGLSACQVFRAPCPTIPLACPPCAPLPLQLAQQLGSNPALAPGGSAAAEGAEAEQAEWREFVAALRAFAALERPWTLEITDPLDSSWVAADGEQNDRWAGQRPAAASEQVV